MKVPDFNPEAVINGRLAKKLERQGLRNDSTYPIPEGMERVWQVFIDGQKVDHYSHVAAKSQYGLMNIGLSLDNGQYITLQEADSSGAVIIPFVIIQNKKVVYLTCRFFPLAQLSQLSDMFSVAAESRLCYYLENY